MQQIAVKPPAAPHTQDVVLALKAMIQQNRWEEKFSEAIASVLTYNVTSMKRIITLEEYFDWLNELLRWIPCETGAGQDMYDRMREFYYIFDQPPLKALQNDINPWCADRRLTPLSQWMVHFAKAWGSFLDTTDSISEESLMSFCRCARFSMNEYMPPPSGYKTYNQLFARQVRPGMRPIEALHDSDVVVSPADSVFVGWWQIDENSRITVKTLQWSVLDLLQGSAYRERFKSGIFMPSFLNINDYHRVHVPVSGTVLESRTILGQVYMDVMAVPIDADEMARTGWWRSMALATSLPRLEGSSFSIAPLVWWQCCRSGWRRSLQW